MKKMIALLLISFQVSLAQTKVETEEWILSKLNTYTQTFNNFSSVSYEIKSGYFISNWYNNDGITILHSRMLIKDISDYRYDIIQTDIGSAVKIFLYCKNNKICAETDIFKNGKFDERLLSDSKKEILLQINFKNDNLPERMKKAFNSLVNLYGGQMQIERY